MEETKEHGAGPVPAVLRPLRAVDGALRRGELVVLVTVLVGMIGLSFAQVVLRKLRPYVPSIQEVAWFDILTRHLVLWVGILGASIAAREGRHFGVEILPKLFTERGRQRLEAVLNVGAGAVTLLLGLGMFQYVRLGEDKALFVIDAVHQPVYRAWLLSIMPLGLGLMTFRFFLRSLEAILLTPEQWHLLERELKPDLTAAAVPAAEPASLGSGAVIEAATPPAVAEKQEKEAHEALLVAEKKVDKSTDEIRVRRLGDLGDVDDPPPEPGTALPADADVALVDSDMTLAQPLDETTEDNAPTERQPPPEKKP